jgi:hypothetical protein
MIPVFDMHCQRQETSLADTLLRVALKIHGTVTWCCASTGYRLTHANLQWSQHSYHWNKLNGDSIHPSKH